VFDAPRHAQIVCNIYEDVPVLWRENPEENPWSLSFLRMLDMANDSSLFLTSDDGSAVPLYEAKMIHHFDSRFATYEGASEAQLNKGTLPRFTLEEHANPYCFPLPRYWVHRAEVDDRLAKHGWHKGWLLGWRNIARSADQRTVICGALPRVAVGHAFPLMFTTAPQFGCLYANLTSFVLDYTARQKLPGSNLTYGFVTQWPVLPPSAYDDAWLRQFIELRVLELTYTAWDMEPFARDLGDKGPPFRWEQERRFAMRAELDAMFFHLYGIERDDLIYIMDSFRAFRNNDREHFDRTKDLILEIYDAMAQADRTGKPYQTILDPAPGKGPRHG
jgi:hypothetical protein